MVKKYQQNYSASSSAFSASSSSSSTSSSSSSSSSSVKYKSKFKQRILLDKCQLVDREDECCFEIQICHTRSPASPSSEQSSQNSSSNSSSSHLRLVQEKEYILFVLDDKYEKAQWMSMLCYTQYKFTIDRLLQVMTEEHNKSNPLPIPPKDYIFDQPDSPETILFELPQQQQQQQQQQQLTNLQSANPYMSSSDGLLIKAASLVKLVERLTHHLYLHPKFSNTFLMFFREFTTTSEFLSLLWQRYHVPDFDAANVNESQPNRYSWFDLCTKTP